MSTTAHLPAPATSPAAPPTRRLRLLPAPDWDPPVDPLPGASRGGAPRPVGQPMTGQRELALDYRFPSGVAAVPSPPALRVAPPARSVGGPGAASGVPEPWTLDDDEPAATLTGRADLPDPRQWAARLAQGVLEVAAGARPSSQLWRWTTQEVLDDIRRRSRPATLLDSQRRRAQVPALVRSVRVCEPADGVVEATAIVAGRLRTRALALRLEGLNGRWLCTALEWV
jgi:hypothetical protein